MKKKTSSVLFIKSFQSFKRKNQHGSMSKKNFDRSYHFVKEILKKCVVRCPNHKTKPYLLIIKLSGKPINE
jgi:hypothetical protein